MMNLRSFCALLAFSLPHPFMMLVNILLPQVLIFQNNFILIAYSQHFVEVIKIIETTHKKLKIPHHEFTLSNFLLDSGNVFLNDLRCCTGYTGLLKGKFVYGLNNFLGVVSCNHMVQFWF